MMLMNRERKIERERGRESEAEHEIVESWESSRVEW